MDRRKFLFKSALSSVALMAGKFPVHAFSDAPEIVKLTILHTNDVHSRIDPFPMDGGRNEGMGGASRRMAMLEDIRLKEKNVLLLDCGDILQGTPYFNFFGGELEFKIMSKMRYDAATLGNHDFDGGMDGLNNLMPLADFPLLCSNYNFSDTVLQGKTKEYQIFEKEGIKIGVFGLGIELDGLVPSNLYRNTQYLDPITRANEVAGILKNDLKCDLVVCISHLGYKFRNEPQKVCDVFIAQESTDIDLILGGHTHTFMRQPDSVKNKNGKLVIINQAGFAGLMLGRLDIYFERSNKAQCVYCKNEFIQ